MGNELGSTRQGRHATGRGAQLVMALGLLLGCVTTVGAATAATSQDCMGDVRQSAGGWDPRVLYLRSPGGGESTATVAGDTSVTMSPGAPDRVGPEERSRAMIRRDPLLGDAQLRARGVFRGAIHEIQADLFRATVHHVAAFEELWIEVAIDDTTVFSGDVDVRYNGHPLVTCHPYNGWYSLRLTEIPGAWPGASADVEHTIQLVVAPPTSEAFSEETLGIDERETATRIFVNPSLPDHTAPVTKAG